MCRISFFLLPPCHDVPFFFLQERKEWREEESRLLPFPLLLLFRLRQMSSDSSSFLFSFFLSRGKRNVPARGWMSFLHSFSFVFVLPERNATFRLLWQDSA